MSDDQYASYNDRINAILDELSIISDRVSSLEERTEPPIYFHKSELCDIPQFRGYKPGQRINPEDIEDYAEWRRTRSASCRGDQLGQCEHGCDGVSKRGSCLDDDKGFAQCGREWAACDSCDEWSCEGGYLPRSVHVRECKYDPSLRPVDNVQSCAIEDEAIDSVSGDFASSCSNKPRSEPVESGDTKYAPCSDSRLGGSTEGRDSEQKANMGDGGWHDGEGRLYCLVHDELVCFYDPMIAAALPAAPVQVVYCCNGAMYEARQ